MDYVGASYDVVEVDSVRRNELKWSKYKKVPVVVVEKPAQDDFVVNFIILDFSVSDTVNTVLFVSAIK